MPKPRFLAAGLLAVALAACNPEPPALPSADVTSQLIRNVVIVDGTGAPRQPGAVRIDGGAIAASGALEPLPGETVIDGGGLVLAPGFIDTHSHADGDLFEQPGALATEAEADLVIDKPFELADLDREVAELLRKKAG